MAAPPWTLLMSYELEIRRKMAELMSEGTLMGTALKLAAKDPVVKERYFTTPLALASVTGAKRKADEAFGTQDSWGSKGRGNNRGKGRGRGGRVRTAKVRMPRAKGVPARPPMGSPFALSTTTRTRGASRPSVRFSMCAGGASRTTRCTRLSARRTEGARGPGKVVEPR